LICYLLISSQYIYASSKVDNVLEQQLKAVYLIHLSEFTVWPAEKLQLPTFNICLDSHSDLNPSLDEVKASGRLVKEKPLVIEHDLTAKNLINCHIFYVDQRNAKLFADLQKQLTDAAVLTISSETGFAQQGGDIEYYLEDGKVRMKGNLKNLSNSNLTISSKVLQLMKIVEGFEGF
jgi:hypothetical protein